MAKPKLAVVKMTGCAGCQMEVLRIEDKLLDLVGAVDVAYFYMATSANRHGPYDVALVEGSVSTPRELRELKELRERTKLLIALGDCACSGCLPSIVNWVPPQESAKVYERFLEIHSKKESFQRVYPLSAHVRVDLELRGCPPHRDAILEALKGALLGIKPFLREHPVCVECKLKENVCLLVCEGRPCMGPVTAAGCGAACPSNGRVCEGCYGPMSDANASSLAEILAKRCGLSREDLIGKFRKYAGLTPAFSKEASGGI